MGDLGDRIAASDRQGEDGAVAVVVALLLTVLLGISAFAVDLGMSYTSSQGLQTASDSAALATAASYGRERVTCSAGNLTPTGGRTVAQMHTDASAHGTQLMLDNHAGATLAPGSFTATCDGGNIVTRWESAASTPASLGGVFGASDIDSRRDASAAVSIPAEARRLRPYAICSDDLPSIPSGITTIRYPGHSSTGSACPAPSGGWLTLSCPVVGAVDLVDEVNGQSGLNAATAEGCSNPVSTVPNQSSIPTVRYTQHLVACNPPLNTPDEDCLAVQTGNVANSTIWDAWRSLLGKEILLPVICGNPPCFPAVQIGSGNGARHPVQRIVGVTVCGFHWGSAAQKHGDTQVGPCAGADAAPGGNNSSDNYLLLVFDYVQLEGGAAMSSCRIGDPHCDGGLRQTALVE